MYKLITYESACPSPKCKREETPCSGPQTKLKSCEVYNMLTVAATKNYYHAFQLSHLIRSTLTGLWTTDKVKNKEGCTHVRIHDSGEPWLAWVDDAARSQGCKPSQHQRQGAHRTGHLFVTKQIGSTSSKWRASFGMLLVYFLLTQD